MCILALQFTQGSLDTACSILFEVNNMADMQRLAQEAQMRGQDDGHDHGDDAGYEEYGAEDYGMPNAPGGNAGAGAGAPMDSQLASLFNSQQFAQIAQRMRENPSFYQEFL